MAGAEGEPGLDLDGEVADAATVTVMRAVNEEAGGAYRLQPFERTRDPIDVRQFFTRQRQVSPWPRRISAIWRAASSVSPST